MTLSARRPTLHSLPLIAAAALTGLAVRTGHAEPPIPVDATPTEPTLLRYHFEVGDVDRYALVVDQEMTITGSAIAESAQTAMAISLQTEQRVIEVDSAGVGRVQQDLGNASVTLSIAQQAVPANDLVALLNGLSMEFRMDPTGHVLESRVGELSDDSLAEMLTLFEDSMQHVTVEFPEEPVAVGDTWSQEIPVELDQTGMALDTVVHADYTLLGYATIADRRCAVLETDVRVTLAGTFEEVGIETRAQGSGTGTGYTYFDHMAGELVQGTMELTLQTQITAEEMDLNQRIAMTMEVTHL